MKLKVYGWDHNGTARRIIAASSWIMAWQANRSLGSRVTLGHMRDYGCTTGNQTEVQLAMSCPGVVFETSTPYGCT